MEYESFCYVLFLFCFPDCLLTFLMVFFQVKCFNFLCRQVCLSFSLRFQSLYRA